MPYQKLVSKRPAFRFNLPIIDQLVPPIILGESPLPLALKGGVQNVTDISGIGVGGIKSSAKPMGKKGNRGRNQGINLGVNKPKTASKIYNSQSVRSKRKRSVGRSTRSVRKDAKTGKFLPKKKV